MEIPFTDRRHRGQTRRRGCRRVPPFLLLLKTLDLPSSSRECVLDRAQHVLMAPIIGRLVADDDVLMGRNRHPNVDAIDAPMAVPRARRDDSNATAGDMVFTSLQTLHLVFDCRASGL